MSFALFLLYFLVAMKMSCLYFSDVGTYKHVIMNGMSEHLMTTNAGSSRDPPL